jgi:hypothetical protein
MNNSHLTLFLYDPNIMLTKEDLVLASEEHRLNKSIIASCMFVVICPSPDLPYPISYLLRFLATPSKSHLKVAKCLLLYIKDTKDLTMAFPCSNAAEISLDGYSNSDHGYYLDTRRTISGNLVLLNNSTVY